MRISQRINTTHVPTWVQWWVLPVPSLKSWLSHPNSSCVTSEWHWDFWELIPGRKCTPTNTQRRWPSVTLGFRCRDTSCKPLEMYTHIISHPCRDTRWLGDCWLRLVSLQWRESVAACLESGVTPASCECRAFYVLTGHLDMEDISHAAGTQMICNEIHGLSNTFPGDEPMIGFSWWWVLTSPCRRKHITSCRAMGLSGSLWQRHLPVEISMLLVAALTASQKHPRDIATNHTSCVIEKQYIVTPPNCFDHRCGTVQIDGDTEHIIHEQSHVAGGC